ncbi:hypothetical protein Flavo103_32430 [Flavobacterium collinsii]|jgi:hypothetical protein|nr:hypothetical protein Flavo103_32430 [Flavobacterium collinsii]
MKQKTLLMLNKISSIYPQIKEKDYKNNDY